MGQGEILLFDKETYSYLTRRHTLIWQGDILLFDNEMSLFRKRHMIAPNTVTKSLVIQYNLKL